MSTLLKAISDSDTTIMFSEELPFPLVAGVILIGTEQIAYDSNYNGTLYGCVRGFNSTSAVSHTVGSDLSLYGYYHALAGEAGSFTSVTVSGLTASRAVITDGSKNLASSPTTSAELAFVNGVTSSIQTQLNTKQAVISAVVSAATVGGGTSESVTVAGLLTTSTIYAVSMNTAGGTATSMVNGYANSVNGQIALTFTADPGAGLKVLVSFKP